MGPVSGDCLLITVYIVASNRSSFLPLFHLEVQYHSLSGIPVNAASMNQLKPIVSTQRQIKMFCLLMKVYMERLCLKVHSLTIPDRKCNNIPSLSNGYLL